MPELTLADLVQATGGSLLRGEPGTPVRSYVIDSRRAAPGALFFALKGTRTDGHRFLGEAARNGAAAAMIQEEPAPDSEAPEALILVEDTVEAMSRCGELARRSLRNVRWIAVTGSNGKTTTKEMLAAALSPGRKIHRTAGNLNNHLGAPLSLLACPGDTDAAVIELAMSGPGEIAALTKMTDPDVGIVTNVRAAHLEFFGSLDNIAAAKGELFACLRDDATAVVNLDDVHVRVQATRHVGPQVTFGRHREADVRIEDLENRFLPGAAMTFRHGGTVRRVQLRIGGAHAAYNALAALAGVVALEGDLDAAVTEIAQLEPGSGRGKIHHLPGQMLLVDDSYNSSPAALASVLETMRLTEPPGRKVLVMGDMLELGPLEDAMHREAGKRAAAAGVQLLFAVGPLSRATAEVARQAGVSEVHHHKDSGKAAQDVAEFLRDGDLIVVKGSRSMRLEKVVQALLSERRETH